MSALGMKRCPVCLQDFEPERKDAVYCSPKCRLRAYRLRAANSLPQPEEAPEEPFPGVPRTPQGAVAVSNADPAWVETLKAAIR
jgi:hypothetical protein